MTFVSVAQAARRLGIDAKTVRGFLAEAHFPLQDHPCDGRKKGVSGEHLDVLARQHQRSLTPLPQEPPAPVPSEVPPLPAALLALPETLCTLQAQIAVLQQQVAELTRLLQPHAQPSAHPAVPVQQANKPVHPPRPASPAPRARPAASAASKPPRKYANAEKRFGIHPVAI
jgi:hypothetical protein